MKTLIKISSLVLLAVLVFVPVQTASAGGTVFDGQVVFGYSYTLKAGDTLVGDLLVFGGTATLEKDSQVNGNVVLFGGSLVANGDVSGDVAVTGGSVKLGTAAHIHGNLTTVGSTLERAAGALVDGQITNTATSWEGSSNSGGNPVVPNLPTMPNFHINFNPFTSLFNAFARSVGLAVLAMLIMLFLAPHADRVAHAVIAQPLTSGGIGLLTLIVAPITLVLLALTIILIPVVALLVVALFVAAVFGWIAIGYEIGQRFTAAIHQNWHPAFSAGLGVFFLTLVASALTGIPVLNCVGWLVPFLLGLAGMGAIIMTRFGTQLVAAPAVVQPAPVAISSPVPTVPELPVVESETVQRKPRAKKES